MVIAGEGSKDNSDYQVRENTKGFIFIGTPHKGAHLTMVGSMLAQFGYWCGSSTSLLRINTPESWLNQALHEAFMTYLRDGCGTKNTVCCFETVTESFLGFPTVRVSVYHCDILHTLKSNHNDIAFRW